MKTAAKLLRILLAVFVTVMMPVLCWTIWKDCQDKSEALFALLFGVPPFLFTIKLAWMFALESKPEDVI